MLNKLRKIQEITALTVEILEALPPRQMKAIRNDVVGVACTRISQQLRSIRDEINPTTTHSKPRPA